jgi:hypothetical protein
MSNNVGLIQLMRIISSMKNNERNNVINSLKNTKRNELSNKAKILYNMIIKKNITSIRKELNKENKRLNEMRAAMVLRRKHRQAATTIQRHYRGRIVRKGIHVKPRHTFVVNPNGNIMLAVRNRRLT